MLQAGLGNQQKGTSLNKHTGRNAGRCYHLPSFPLSIDTQALWQSAKEGSPEAKVTSPQTNTALLWFPDVHMRAHTNTQRDLLSMLLEAENKQT